MKHLLKYQEWQTPYGWETGDTSDLVNGSNTWWYPTRMLGIAPADYVLLLKDTFHADKIRYFPDKNLLIFHWKNYSDCHKFTFFINQEARKRRFMI